VASILQIWNQNRAQLLLSFGLSFVKGIVCPVKNRGEVKNIEGVFVKGAD